jgi:hypothetical protein
MSVSQRRATEGRKCPDCKRGRVIRREDFYDFWLERFTVEEICEMNEALKGVWG